MSVIEGRHLDTISMPWPKRTMLNRLKITSSIESTRFSLIPWMCNGSLCREKWRSRSRRRNVFFLRCRISSAWYLFGRQQVSKYHEQAKNIVHIHLCLLRLSGDLATDILISFNDPVFVRFVNWFVPAEFCCSDQYWFDSFLFHRFKCAEQQQRPTDAKRCPMVIEWFRTILSFVRDRWFRFICSDAERRIDESQRCWYVLNLFSFFFFFCQFPCQNRIKKNKLHDKWVLLSVWSVIGCFLSEGGRKWIYRFDVSIVKKTIVKDKIWKSNEQIRRRFNR